MAERERMVQQHRRGAARCALHVRPLQCARQLQSQAFRDGAACLLRLLTQTKLTWSMLRGSGLSERPEQASTLFGRSGHRAGRSVAGSDSSAAARYHRRATRSCLRSPLQLQQQLLSDD